MAKEPVTFTTSVPQRKNLAATLGDETGEPVARGGSNRAAETNE